MIDAGFDVLGFSFRRTVYTALVLSTLVLVYYLSYDCKHADIAGFPKTGIHKHVFNIPIGDVLPMILLAWLIARFGKIDPIWTPVVVFGFAVYCHWAFCVPTFSGWLLGLNS